METYPIFLVVDNFGVEYVGKKHADQLAKILKNIPIFSDIVIFLHGCG